tara:strand:- start:31849 stop:32454 length:606 start_codon:yes stop_codon:yes gene_type:complete
MIFYGTSSSRLKNGQLNNVTCPNCENQTSMTYGVFGKYFYLYWIPIFPIGKDNILECNSCKKTFKLKELPNQIKKRFELEKHSGIPILHFSGLLIIACVIAYFSYSSSKHKELESVYIKEPAIGDVYSIETETAGHYTSMRITNIINDSIHVLFNDYEIDKKTGIDQIDKDKNYTDQNDGYTKEEILSLYNDKIIYEINRD